MFSSKLPLISIVTTCKNTSAIDLESCISSILNQTYPYIEYIIQDGNSCLSETVRILQKYKGYVKIYTKCDRIADEGLLSAYSMCSGDWIGTCLSDETFKSTDVENVCMAILSNRKYSRCSAIYGNCEVVYYKNNTILRKVWSASRKFNLDYFLCRKLKIPLISTFFNGKKFKEAGLNVYYWTYDVAENEIFLRLSLLGDICYVPDLLIGSYFVGGFNLSVSPFAIRIQMLGLERMVENIKSAKVSLPFFLKKREVYIGMQYLYLCLKFLESQSYKEAFDCFFTSLIYKPQITSVFKLLCKFLSTKYKTKALSSFFNFMLNKISNFL